jgi:hypothetical protein
MKRLKGLKQTPSELRYEKKVTYAGLIILALVFAKMVVWDHGHKGVVPSNIVPMSFGACHLMEHTDTGADGLASGVIAGDVFTQHTAEDCCNACIQHFGSPNRCNVFVWHPETKACWLKYATRKVENPKGMSRAPDIPWTTGLLFDFGPRFVDSAEHATCVHVVFMADGDTWQTKILFESFRALSSKSNLLAHFTRILVSEVDDELMRYIPTVRFKPEEDAGFAARASALMHWAADTRNCKCSHVLLVAPGQIFMRPLPHTHFLPSNGNALAFYYGDEMPVVNAAVLRKYFENVDVISQTASAPVLATTQDLKTVSTVFYEVQRSMETDEVAIAELGLLRDKYAFSVAAARTGLYMHSPHLPHNPLMIKTASNSVTSTALLMHYVDEIQINADGKLLWQFSKNSYGNELAGTDRLASLPSLPEWRNGLTFTDGNTTVSRNTMDNIRRFVRTFNACVYAHNIRRTR